MKSKVKIECTTYGATTFFQQTENKNPAEKYVTRSTKIEIRCVNVDERGANINLYVTNRYNYENRSTAIYGGMTLTIDEAEQMIAALTASIDKARGSK